MKDIFALQLSKSTAAGNRARPVKRLSGTGVVTTASGKEFSVEYHLSYPKDETDTNSEGPTKTAQKELSGQVWCPYDGSFVSVHQGKVMTLSLADGRRLRFHHRNRDGGIVVTEWLG